MADENDMPHTVLIVMLKMMIEIHPMKCCDKNNQKCSYEAPARVTFKVLSFCQVLKMGTKASLRHSHVLVF